MCINIFRKRSDNIEFDGNQTLIFTFYFLSTLLVWWFTLKIFQYLEANHQREMIEYLEQLQELRNILDNLDQSIFIYSEDKIDFTNYQFL